jgi:hypothetical protein
MASKNTPYRPFTAYMPSNLKNNIATSKNNGEGYYDSINEALDLAWGGHRNADDKKFNNYFDYFFSGEDVKVYIDGLFDESDEMDIASLTFVVKQEKQPLYGFWSYNYDAVMSGTRLITGEFSIYSRYPRRMTDLLEKAANVRYQSSSSNPGKSVMSVLGSDAASMDDELNINKYWANSELDRLTSGSTNPALSETANGNHNIFSAHPPFNLVIFYSVEDSSLSANGISTYSTGSEVNQQLNSERIIATDFNQRKTTIDKINDPMKIVLQSVNLISMSTSYSSGGEALVESYQFMARDHYFTSEDISHNANQGQREASVANQDAAGTGATVSKTTTTTSGITAADYYIPGT